MTAKEFQNDEVNRKLLTELLSNPVLQRALAILKTEIEPSRADGLDGNPVASAAKYHQVAGANHIFQGLHRLTQIHKEPVPLKGRTLISETPPTS